MELNEEGTFQIETVCAVDQTIPIDNSYQTISSDVLADEITPNVINPNGFGV